MREAYRRTRKDGAVGIDGVTAADYEKDLEANLDDLLGRMKSGRYFARPVRRHATPSWHSDVRRQGGAAGDPDASGTDLRGRLSAVLVRLPAWALNLRCLARIVHEHHGATPAVGDRC